MRCYKPQVIFYYYYLKYIQRLIVEYMNMNTASFRLVVVVILASHLPLAAQQTSRLTNRQITAIDSTIHELMARTLTPGVSVAVASGKEIIWSKGYGKADLENDLPANANTVYRL